MENKSKTIVISFGNRENIMRMQSRAFEVAQEGYLGRLNSFASSSKEFCFR